MGDKEKKGFPCPHEGCKSVFNRPYRLSEHLFVHFNYRAYQCIEPGCQKSYSNKSHLTRHINTAHRTRENVTLYSCPSCTKKYSNRQNLQRHIKEYHTPGSARSPRLYCDVCNLDFRTRNQLGAHMYTHTGVKYFSCERCQKQFITHHEKCKHMRMHKTYQCTDCQMTFDSHAKIQEHRQTNHKVEEYICDDCGMTFKLRCYLVRHIKIHAGMKLHQCPYETCQKFYTRKSNLNQHILVTHMRYTYNCTICPAQLSTKAKLDYHMNLHNSPKKEKLPPKTLATGRKIRSDKGITKSSTALKIAGLPEALVEVCME